MEWKIREGEMEKENHLITEEGARKLKKQMERKIEDLDCELVLVGRVPEEGFSEHDIDFELRTTTWKEDGPCETCQEFAKRIDDIEPPCFTEIFCKGCGSRIKWKDGWTFYWSPQQGELVRKWPEGERKVSITNFNRWIEKTKEIDRRLEHIEDKLSL